MSFQVTCLVMESPITIGNHSCLLKLDPVDLTSLEFILPTLTLATLNVVVIIGNLLVVAAVLTTVKLQTVTNTFIVSLAVADLLVGVFVLPFSNANEVLRYWTFGPIWCSVWLAVDVWLCTASILNLCAISLDRYLAISKPFKYPNLMTPKRGKILVALVWVLSFLICFPPLIGWNEQRANLGERFKNDEDGNQNKSDVNEPLKPGSPKVIVEFLFDNVSYNVFNYSGNHGSGTALSELLPCEVYYPECGLTSDPGYIIYSSMGSFFIPMLIMAFFYWKIYRTAVRTTTALKRGILTMKTHGDMASLSEDTSVMLRVHRGGGASCNYSATSNSHTGTENKRSTGSIKDTKAVNGTGNMDGKRVYIRETSIGQKDANSPSKVRLKECETPSCESPLLSEDQQDQKTVNKKKKTSAGNKAKTKVAHKKSDPEEMEEYRGDNKNVTIHRKGKKDFRVRLKKLNKEKKAAKTVGIIVGGFILCWFPFFTVYLIGAFCETCTPPLAFSVFFWLGYCNSALNPCIYALFSRDFRYAFKRLVACRCHCEQPQHMTRRTGLWSVIYGMRFQASSSRGSDSNSE